MGTVYDSFVMLQAGWPAGQARELIEELGPSHVIVHQTGRQDEYYLFTWREVRVALVAHQDEVPLATALRLRDVEATPVLDAYSDPEAALPRAVVVEEHHVLGFIDDSSPGTIMGHVDGEPIGDSPAAKAGPVTRYLQAEFPERVQVEQTVSLLVWLSADSETGLGQPIAVPVGTPVDVIVQAKRGLELVGNREGSLLASEFGETLPLQFKLRATEPGRGRIRILAFQQGQPLGALTLTPLVVPAGEEIETARPRVGSHPLPSPSLQQPDLSVLILEATHAGRPAFTIHLSAVDPDVGLHFKPFGPVQFRKDPEAYFQEFFEDIETLPLRTPEQRAAAEEHLAAKGSHLFETLFPRDLQALLWSLRDRIQTMQILSEEPWIPWELCKLQGEEDGWIVEGAFLCEAFSVTRWMPRVDAQPDLRLRKMALVVPSDSGLQYAAQERDYLLSLAGDGRHVERIPATFSKVRGALAQGEYDGWHFTGHGSFRDPDPNRSGLELEARAKLIPEDLSGRVRNLGRARPLVFLNACQAGRGAMSLTDIGGWASKFLWAGAAAFVGAQWSIDDEAANSFARAFYGRLLEGMTIGQATQEARLAIKPMGDPTWLAYTVFADPLARVQ